jgi:large subunit ribosomal protein L22
MYSKKVTGSIAKACTHNARISVKNAKHVCRAIRGMYLDKAKKFLEDVIKQKRNINGKYYTKSAKEVLKIILSAEKNAEFKNLDLDKVYIAHIAALKGHKRSLGMRMKTAHLEVILKERASKEEKKSGEEKSEVQEKKSDTNAKIKSEDSKDKIEKESKNTKN